MEQLIDELKEHDVARVYELIRRARQKEYEVCVWGCGVIGKNWVKQLLTYMNIHIDYYCCLLYTSPSPRD